MSVEKKINGMKNINSVAVHIRRGDFVEIGRDVDIEYYDKAISMIRNKTGDAVFYSFFDDAHFCKEYFLKYDGLLKYEIVDLPR